MSKNTQQILTFVHIEKAAGTTLIYLLRRNFLFGHCDVRPLLKSSKRIISAADLKIYCRLNPWVRSIAGHALSPSADLEKVPFALRYITILRDPMDRYLSQYQYWRERLDVSISFETFMTREFAYNTQTKKICGTNDVESAKRILSKFFLVGVKEHFDEFLLMLSKKMAPSKFCPYYILRNMGDKKSCIGRDRNTIFEKYRAAIQERNQLDMELYRYVIDELLPRQKAEYGATLEADVERFKVENLDKQHSLPQYYLDYVYRKFYLEPFSGFIRSINRKPRKGSY